MKLIKTTTAEEDKFYGLLTRGKEEERRQGCGELKAINRGGKAYQGLLPGKGFSPSMRGKALAKPGTRVCVCMCIRSGPMREK